MHNFCHKWNAESYKTNKSITIVSLHQAFSTICFMHASHPIPTKQSLQIWGTATSRTGKPAKTHTRMNTRAYNAEDTLAPAERRDAMMEIVGNSLTCCYHAVASIYSSGLGALMPMYQSMIVSGCSNFHMINCLALLVLYIFKRFQ